MTWDRRWTLFAASLTVIAAFFVLREHWQHALGLASYLLLLACPLMHLFHGHGRHRHGAGDHRTKTDDPT
ncbi:hypothetical protein ILFOPFJJ_05727 [Ensifer psoraleae]|uniref:DUF2933 domain-containing protein n=1 Tax=Sinorhizobium psoraleae TaxID=520838 RepID=UPI00156A734F|nr:DUF2933 domain-containing protein [Sinorhizobium psoraleae]NRP74805.1 hypothetical protein [Sinorhizobium psoraleae]